MNVTELFSRVALFEGIAPEDRVALAKAAALRTYRRGETIVEQGQPGDAFYVIVKGRVAVAIVAPDGREVVLNSLGEGEHFGEMALLDDAPRSAPARSAASQGSGPPPDAAAPAPHPPRSAHDPAAIAAQSPPATGWHRQKPAPAPSG